jgi:hypothetical protein
MVQPSARAATGSSTPVALWKTRPVSEVLAGFMPGLYVGPASSTVPGPFAAPDPTAFPLDFSRGQT